MKRTALALAVALMVVPSVLGVSGANPRGDPLDTQGNINDLAIAADRRHIVVATQDAGNFPNDLELNTWYLWESDGDLLQAGDGDMSNCNTRLDTCISHSVAVTVSDDGRRMAVGTDIPPSLSPVAPDSVRGQVHFITETQGVVFSKSFDQNLIDLDFDAEGDTLAVALRLPQDPGSADHALIFIYSWTGGGANTLALLTSDEVDFPVLSIDLSADGQRLAVASDRYHRYNRGSDLPAINTGVSGKVNDVAIAEGRDHWTVAGYTTGRVVLYSNTDPALPRANRLVTEAPITSVAIRRDALGEGIGYAAGDQNGKLHLFAIDSAGTTPGVLLSSLTLGTAAVQDVAYTKDGRFLVARSGTVLQFLEVTTSGARSLWTHAFTEAPTNLAVDGKGELVAATIADEVLLFDASHDIRVTLPDSPTMAPSSGRDLEAVFRNAGNRPESLTLGADFPSGWALVMNRTHLDLEPGEEQPVSFRLVVGATAPPGETTVFLNYTLAGVGLDGSAPLEVDVPVLERVLLEAVGSPSLGVEPGASAQYRFNVVNAGNTAERVNLRATVSRPGWAAALSESDLSLSPGQERELRLTLEAPSDAVRGDSARVTVQVTSDPSELLVFTGTVGASFGPGLALPAGVEVPAGNTTRFTVTVRNDGNAPDDVSLVVEGLPVGWVLAFDNGQSTFTLHDLPSHESTTAVATLRVPVTAEPGATALTFRATSLGNQEESATKAFLVTVLEPYREPDGGGKDGSALAFVPVAAALALAALARRRKEP